MYDNAYQTLTDLWNLYTHKHTLCTDLIMQRFAEAIKVYVEAFEYKDRTDALISLSNYIKNEGVWYDSLEDCVDSYIHALCS